MKFIKGQEVQIVNAPVYPTYDSKVKVKNISGNYFIYDTAVRNNRIRVTNDRSKVDIPCAYTGWVNISDITVDAE